MKVSDINVLSIKKLCIIKEIGKSQNGFGFFDPSMDEHAIFEQLKSSESLRRSIDNNLTTIDIKVVNAPDLWSYQPSSEEEYEEFKKYNVIH